MDVTTKPLIMDIDTGKLEHLQSHIVSLQNKELLLLLWRIKKV